MYISRIRRLDISLAFGSLISQFTAEQLVTLGHQAAAQKVDDSLVGDATPVTELRRIVACRPDDSIWLDIHGLD